MAEAKGAPGATQKSVAYASDSKGTTHTGSHSHTNRPAWALTETAAAVASEEKTQGDEDDLLDFAASLGIILPLFINLESTPSLHQPRIYPITSSIYSPYIYPIPLISTINIYP